MKALYTDIQDNELYGDMHDKNAVYYPRYAEATYRYGSRHDFWFESLKYATAEVSDSVVLTTWIELTEF